MRQPWITCGLLVLAPFAGPHATSQSNAHSAAEYSLNVAVDEVSLTFRAVDVHNLPINDLNLDELSIHDNGKPPGKILSFQPPRDFPIRAGILIDTSESTEQNLPRDRAISIQYAQQLLRQQTDQAFIMDFGYISKITQPWTSDPVALAAGVRNITTGKENPIGGTALFDSIYRACFYEFGKVDHAASGNFILLFSDGEDNASHTSLKDVMDVCQRSNTAIYVLGSEPKLSWSSGPKTLAQLAAESGGRVFHDDDTEAAINNDLHSIEADLRNQYRLVYKPAVFKHDGSFHHIELKASDRVDSISVRSGYYAPSH
jgi:Ca-activated chloride channel family protein